MSTEQFVAALTEYQLDPTEIAEVLWLALKLPPVESDDEADQDDPTDDADDLSGGDTDDQFDADDVQDADLNESDDESANDSPDDAFPIAPELPSGILPKQALPISIPDADILDDTLPLVRALKPLLKQIESQVNSYINEVETVDRIAETDIWSPVLNPDYEPWFEVALVIDGSPAMSLWQRLIQDMQRLLRSYGSFRDFRVWQLVVNGGDVGIRPTAEADAVVRSPSVLLAPDARRLILVFSDCTADYWWEGKLQPALAQWGASTPTAIWQVLPDWMWKRTALGVGEYVAVRNHQAGAQNTRLTPVFLSLQGAARRREPPPDAAAQAELSSPLSPPICIPVVTGERQSLTAWSQMLAGDLRSSTPGFVLPPTGWPTEATHDDTADDLLETFRRRATPSARRLAALLSAAPVITLPVMRLIRASDELLPGSSPVPVAEVFLGGLLQKAPDQPPTADVELVQYTFPDEVRDRLLGVLPQVDAIEVIEAVSKHVAERLNCTLSDFRALLLSPDLKDEADRYGLRSFAQMTAQILSKVGGFEDLVRQLEGPSVPPDPETDSDTQESDWLAAFTHQPLTYTVAEFIDFPPLSGFDFIDAQLDDTPTFPPPLQTVTFPLITFATAADRLAPFEFTVATLQRQTIQTQGQQQSSDWIIQRQTQSATRLVESLPGDIDLEMVLIPGGSFTMGSPNDEPQRYDDESPQHEVTVPPFCMGRYPITQAQWRAVAAMPQVERELNPDPANFKGYKRPVENVSWHAAVEFCARLSAHTARQYRLPSEAEWEYACRAGTTTPFHFGDMISTEIANCNGSPYADGPRGGGRGKTTPVDYFGIANAFGLSDMHGNVFEWCQDPWHSNYKGAPKDGSVWPGNSSNRVRRGGSWYDTPRYCRSACRDYFGADNRDNLVGFRVCCSVPRPALS
jgi:formylglycine-generating enzyme required for sulfatase activity